MEALGSLPGDTIYASFNSISFSATGVDTGQLNQVSDENWIALRGWDANDGGKWQAVGGGSNIDVGSAAAGGGENIWEGRIKAPYMINLENLFIHRGDPDSDYADAVVKCYGIKDPNGKPLVATAEYLRAAGTYVQKNVYSWIAANSGEVPPYVAWTGYTVGPNQQFALDRDWAQGAAEFRTDGTYNDLYIIWNGWPITASSRLVDPTISSVFDATHAETIDVNDPPVTAARPIAFRPSDWEGSGGLTVGGGNNDFWSIEVDASAPKVTRLFKTVWYDRNNAVGGTPTPEFVNGSPPVCYLANKANLDPNYPLPADGTTTEDVTNYSNHAYLRIGFLVPVPATLTVTVDYSITTASDPHVTGQARVDGYSWARERRTAEYEVTYEDTGSQFVDLDLPSAPGTREQTVYRNVDRVTFGGFPESTTWTLNTLELREAASNSVRTLKAEMPAFYRYTGGISGVVDGKRTLWLEDSVGKLGERMVPFLNIVDGATSGLDLTTPYNLAQVTALLSLQEGYSATWDTGDWNIATRDPDLNQIDATGQPWDIVPGMRLVEGDAWDLGCSIRVNGCTIVPGLLYKPHLTKFINALGHGVVWNGTERNPGVTVYVFRRAQGTTIWEQFDETVADALGYWWAGKLRVLATQGDDPPTGDVFMEYGVSLSESIQGVTLLGTGYNREWITASLAGGSKPELAEDYGGRLWLVYLSGGRVYTRHRTRADADEPWSPRVEVTKGLSGTYDDPAIAILPTGVIVVAATDTKAGHGKVWRSRDYGRNWEVPV